MPENLTSSNDRSEFAPLLTRELGRAGDWSESDISDIFHHQMKVPLSVELSNLDPECSARLRAYADDRSLVIKSLSDLLTHPTPPVELLQMIKDFAKANRTQTEEGLPGPVASSIYYLAIASAWVALGRRITTMADEGVVKGLRWTAKRPWIGPAYLGILEQAAETWNTSANETS